MIELQRHEGMISGVPFWYDENEQWSGVLTSYYLWKRIESSIVARGFESELLEKNLIADNSIQNFQVDWFLSLLLDFQLYFIIPVIISFYWFQAYVSNIAFDDRVWVAKVSMDRHKRSTSVIRAWHTCTNSNADFRSSKLVYV